MRRFGAILHSMETGDSYKKQPTDENLMKQFDYLRKIQEAYVSNEEYQIETFDSFFSPNFKPSHNFYGLIKDLRASERINYPNFVFGVIVMNHFSRPPKR